MNANGSVNGGNNSDLDAGRGKIPFSTVSPNFHTMVQGKTKGLQSKSPSRRPTKSSTDLKKGKKYIAPKKPALVKQASVHKVAISYSSSGCTSN
jgi:hypothetical protein